jgi:hypothetical protein
MPERASHHPPLAAPVACAYRHTTRPRRSEGNVMELTRIAGTCDEGGDDCGQGDCPTVYTTDRGTIAVQGYTVTRRVPDGEAVVEIPREILLEAARALGR